MATEMLTDLNNVLNTSTVVLFAYDKLASRPVTMTIDNSTSNISEVNYTLWVIILSQQRERLIDPR